MFIDSNVFLTFFNIFTILDEYRGHTYLEAVKSSDLSKIKRIIAPDLVNFVHPLTLNSALVSVWL